MVTEPAPIKGGEREMLGFETLTLAPMDRKLVDKALLTPEEIDQLNAYHASVSGRGRTAGSRRDESLDAVEACAPI